MKLNTCDLGCTPATYVKLFNYAFSNLESFKSSVRMRIVLTYESTTVGLQIFVA